jgi:hypothetical protein
MDSCRYAIGEYTTTVSQQRLGKHVPAETNTRVTRDLLWERGVFHLVHAEMLRVGQFEAPSSNLLYVYDYITKSCRQQAEVIQNHGNEYVRSIGQDEAKRRKYKRLKHGGGQAYDRSSD